MKILAIAGGLALTVLGGDALAQNQTPLITGLGPNYVLEDAQLETIQQSRMIDSEEWRMRTEERLAEEDPERVDLARRVALLADEGRCREARALANAEGDRQIALRVRQTCRPRPQ